MATTAQIEVANIQANNQHARRWFVL